MAFRNRFCTDQSAPFLGGKLRHEPGDEGSGEKKKGVITKRLTNITNIEGKAEKNGSSRRRDPADVVAEAGARSPQERGEQRRKVHGKKTENTGAKTDGRKPEKKFMMGSRSAKRSIGREEEEEKHRHQRLAIAQVFRQPPSKE